MRNYPCKCICIPNVIEKMPGRLAKLENKKLISDGRLSREKGYMDLLKIYDSLIEQIDDMIRHDRDIAKKENHETVEDPLIDFIKTRQ